MKFNRRGFLMVASGLLAGGRERNARAQGAEMPTLFVGHGSPMNALDGNRFAEGFRAAARAFARPKAILAISAHFCTPSLLVTAQATPRTIHDFGGFPRALYELEYPAPGRPELASQIARVLVDEGASPTQQWGLDHGTWTVLRHMYPAADIPVVQLSLNRQFTPQQHLEIGRRLAPLKEEGVLIFASGNVTHNLRHAFRQMGGESDPTPHWARRFDRDVAAMLEGRDGAGLSRALSRHTDAQLAHPTPEHFLPLLYALGAAGDDSTTFFNDDFDLSSLSMRSALLS